MTERATHTVAVVGLGLVGGSLALALAERGVMVHGADASADTRRLARSRGVRVVDDVAQVGDARPDVVVLAVPLGQLATVVAELLPVLPPHATVLHTVGLQGSDALGLDEAAADRVIGAHPMAGSHSGGFTAARADLFHGATVLLEARAGLDASARAEWLWRTAGAAGVQRRTAAEHDRLMAWASHLPQLVATAVAATLADVGVAADAGGPGLRDVTRLAASPAAVWRDLLRAAPAETADALASTARTLDQLARAVSTGDVALLDDTWARAGRWRGAMEDAR